MAASERLRQMTAPFILRRLKKDVSRIFRKSWKKYTTQNRRKAAGSYNGQLVHMQKLLKNQNEDDFNKTS